MKHLLLILSIVFSFNFVSARAITATDLTGIFVGYLNIEGPYFVTQLILSPNGTINYREANLDYVMPQPGCNGLYELTTDYSIYAVVDCSAVNGPSEITMVISLESSNYEDLYSKNGARVSVVSSHMGSDPIPFRIHKQDQLFFP